MDRQNVFLTFALLAAMSQPAGAQELKLSYSAADTINSTTLRDLSGNGYDGRLVGSGISISRKFSEQSVFISTSRLREGFVDIGESFGDVMAELDEYTIAARIYVSTSYWNVQREGNVLWSFSNNDSIELDGGGYASFSVDDMEYSISLTDESEKTSVSAGRNIETGGYKWVVVTCTRKESGDFIRIYEDGKCAVTGFVKNALPELGKTKCNWIGRSPLYDVEADYSRGMIMTDFRVYDAAMSDRQIAELSEVEYSFIEPEKLLQYNFNDANDETGTYKGSLGGSAALRKIADVPVLDLGSGDGYFDMGTGVGDIISSVNGDFFMSLNVYIPATTVLGSPGNFFVNFGNSSSEGYTNSKNVPCLKEKIVIK